MTPHSVTKILGLAATMALAPAAEAVNFGDMFNPGRWFGGGNDWDDYYYDGPYGGYGPYGGGPWGVPGYGYGYGPYGVPGYGYGAAPYGYAPGVGVAPGYATPAAPAATASDSNAKDREIEALKRRIDQLENRQSAPSPRPAAPPPESTADKWPSAPAFRPMDQY